MDKFTVDLDQVLNDFEYSELTDQYNATRPQIDTSSSVNNSSVTKHSINNVFHSLNEYLNTSVDIPNIENNLKEADVLKKVENVDVGSTGNPSDDKENNKPVEDCADNKFFEEDKRYVNHNSTFGNEAKNLEELNEILSVQINENTNFTNKNIDTTANSVQNEYKPDSIDEDLTKSKDEKFNFNKGKINEEKENEDIFYKEKNESVNIDKDNILVQLDTPNVISNDSNFKIEENIILVDDQVEPSLSIINDQEIIEQNIIDREISDEKYEEQEVINPVGFQEVIDVDDEEIHELLAELENDTDLIESEFQKNDSHEKKGNQIADEIKDFAHLVDHIITEPEPIIATEEPIIGNLPLEPDDIIENELDDTITEKINTEPEETIPIDEIEQTNKDPNNVIEKLTEEITDSNITEQSQAPPQEEVREEEKVLTEKKEHLQEAKETDVKNEKIAKEESTNSKQEESNKNDESDKKTEEVKGDINISSQETVARPQNLPLKESENEGQREINLIGGPGSTPYNNVYIAEEITKQQERDNESISSTSSNTFSDTGSTASTASTEEIRDDNDLTITNPSSIQQQPTRPNENLERGSRELSDDGDKAENAAEEISDQNEMSTGESNRNSADGDIASSGTNERQWLGKEAPLWIPDSDTTSCLHCDMKFTVLKRRHHCRACGLVLCSKCCHLRFKLEYLDAEARVCNKCHDILNKDTNSSSSSDLSSPDPGNSPLRRPNPNNPLEYCSTISPLQQVSGSSITPLPAVMVPVGVLKRKGSNKAKSNKSVMFCDGIRPGSDLTNLDNDFNYNNTKTKKLEKTSTTASAGKINRNLPLIDSETNSFIPKNENSLPPLITITKTDVSYTDCLNNPTTVELLKNDQLTFAILLSLYVHVKVINMNCCINKMAWCFSTEGLINVGQDELIIILEYIDEEAFVPKDVFYHINNIYADAVKGTSIKELGLSLHNSSNFLDSKNHAGFVYIRPTFQCMENVIKPKEPFLVGILIHRWETPWAKLFPLRLILRLGAEYRYYPSPVISTRHRDSVFVEIGHTIINLLADFRNFSYTLPQISGLTIHMEDKNTTVTIPFNRYDQIIKSLNNSSDHILAFGGSFSQEADSHLVCIQDTQGNENCYSTHAINIQNKPRKVTGASFIVFNGALKSSSGLTAKSNIVEDGLMIQVLPEHMQQIRDNLRAMKNHTIPCGCVNADTDETVNIVWGENDTNFNIGVTSSIDGTSLSGIPSIRVHNGKNHYGANGNRIIRWTEVFIIQSGDDGPKNQDPIDISRISENIAKATCDALLNYLDLLVTNNFQKIGIRTTLHVDSVSYFAGSNNTKLPPIYMKSLDNELIPVLHRITSGNLGENSVILELIFRILNV